MNEKEIVKEEKVSLYKPVGYKVNKCPNCPYNDRDRDCFLCHRERDNFIIL